MIWKGHKACLSKASDWNPILFKIKRKQNVGRQNKEYNSIFKDIHQNIRAYPRSKKKSAKTLLRKQLGKHYCILGGNLSKVRCRWTNAVCSTYNWGSGGTAQLWENSIVFTLMQAWKQYFQHKIVKKTYKYQHFLFLKTANTNINCMLLLSYKHALPERVSSQSWKIWNQGEFRNLNFLTL